MHSKSVRPQRDSSKTARRNDVEATKRACPLAVTETTEEDDALILRASTFVGIPSVPPRVFGLVLYSLHMRNTDAYSPQLALPFLAAAWRLSCGWRLFHQSAALAAIARADSLHVRLSAEKFAP